MPISWMKAIAAVYFGLPWGFIYSLLAAIISASLSFLIARLIGKKHLEGLFNKFYPKKQNKMTPIVTNIEKYSFEYIFILRNIYIVPFTPTNYILGITKISFKKYFFASLLGMIPGTFTYTFFFSKSIDILENWTEGILPVTLIIIYFLLMVFLKKKFKVTDKEIIEK